jgi:hypothetical protein
MLFCPLHRPTYTGMHAGMAATETNHCVRGEREKKTKISRACVPHQSSSLDQVMSKLHMIKYRSHARERYQGPASPACLISHDFARDRYDA